MPDKGPCGAWRERPVYWSTLRYLRAWWATDGVHVKLVRKRRRLDWRLLRSIAEEYRVVRLIAAAEKSRVDRSLYPDFTDDLPAEVMCSLLDRVQTDWPDDLPGRARVCCEIMDAAQEARLAVPIGRGQRADEPKDLVSLTTKLVWFLKPDEWTVFDNLAANGLGLPGMNPRNRMLAFYRHLDEEGAVDVMRRMQPIIEKSVVPDLPASRILDTLLMTRANPIEAERRIDEQRAFLCLLPEPTRAAVTDLATALQTEADRSPHTLTSPDCPGQAERRKAKR